MNRRDSFKYLSVGCSLPFIKPGISYDGMTVSKAAHDYVYLDVHSTYPTTLSSNFRVPFQWDYFGIGKDEEATILSLKGTIDTSCKALRLRLTTALDSREEKQVEVSIPEYNIVLGILDCKYSPLLQITELAIEKKYLALVQENGLRLKSTLPFAVLARLYPEHPILKKVEKFWTDRLNSLGAIVDYSITAEGAYTIAYPMAVLAQAWERQDLAKMALQQLRIRGKLVYEGANYLRYYPDTQKRTYKNWARGIAWYMLVIVRTLSILKDTEGIDDLIKELNRVTNFVLLHQKENGLWNCFIDEQNTIIDTSGSAGTSAAIASGIHKGFLPKILKSNINKTWQGLLPFLTPDGLLSGVAQSNRAGEELQKSNYRVISQMGMGLMGQLSAYL